MLSIFEFELYNLNGFESSKDDFNFYYDEILKARNSVAGILIGFIVPNVECGHIDFFF
jgi:hypothetical protein